MNIGASIVDFPPRINAPPNHSTIIISTVPRNSLIGWARDWRMVTRLFFLLIASVTLSNLSDIFFSAMNALMMRRPPRVSSTCAITSLQSCWTSSDFLFRFFPTTPITHIISGANRIVNAVICQLMTRRATK